MYTIRQVAEITGFSPDTLRYYEKMGLVRPPERGPGGARVYGEDHLRSLTSVKCLKRAGLSLDEIKAFIQEGQCFANRSTIRDEEAGILLDRVRILTEHLHRMEEQRRELDDLIGLTREKLTDYHQLLDNPREISEEFRP